MFFESVDEIPRIAKKSGTSIFVVPDETVVEIKNAIVLEPVGKTVISIEQVKEMLLKLSLKQTKEQFVVVRPADKLGLEAANALLKNLEEPGEKLHFVLITSMPSRLLPTILSRAMIYFLKDEKGFNLEIQADEKTRTLAKKLITAKPADLVPIMTEIASKKDGVRSYTLEILSVAIEMLYKSYFLTSKPIFIKKIPKFLTAYENINRNGHIKLHLVADLC